MALCRTGTASREKHGKGCLGVSEEPILGFDISEAEVVRTIYRMSGAEKKSCQKIAAHLNRAGIPCRSAENQPAISQESAAGERRWIWRPSHVRNMIVSRTYMGEHHFGKRSTNRNRKIIVREVPAIVPTSYGKQRSRCFGPI